jgi:hypothetical protein
VAGSAILAIKIIADASQAVKELGNVGKSSSDFEKGIKGLSTPAAGIAGALGAMTIAAAEDQRQTQALNKIYQNATGTTDDYTGAIEAASKAGEDKAFTDNAVRDALKPLIIATGDAEEANKLLGPALDIARVAGVSAETAAVALAKAHEGSAAALAGLLPGLDTGASSTDAIANATTLAAGAAAEYAASGPGQIALVGNAFTELGEAIGATFLPIISELAPKLKEVADYLTQQKDILGPLAVVFGVGALAVLALNAAMALLSINPITLFVLALAGIAAGFVMLYQRSEAFRTIVDGVISFAATLIQTLVDAIHILGGVAQTVFDAIGTVVSTVFGAIKTIFDGVLAWAQAPFVSFQEIVDTVFGIVGTIVSTVIDGIALIFAGILAWLRVPFESFQTIVDTVMGLVGGFVQATFDGIKTLWDGLLAILKGPFEAFDDVVQTVMDTVTGIVETAVGVIQGIIDGIAGAIGALEDTADAITPWSVLPGGGGGGAAPSPALALMGRRTARSAGMAGGGPNVNINVTSADPSEVVRAIRRWSRNNGGSGPFNRGLDRSTA